MGVGKGLAVERAAGLTGSGNFVSSCFVLFNVDTIENGAYIFHWYYGGDDPLFSETTGNRYKNTSTFLVKRPSAAFLFSVSGG